MNIHEYQGKALLRRFGVNVPEGFMVDHPDQVREKAVELQEKTGTASWVVKAQIHAGGRGKGGGVKIAKDLPELHRYVGEILGMQLVTHQTGPEGKKVSKLLIEENIYYPGSSPVQEFYLGMLLNRATGKINLMYSTEGGMDI